MAVLTAYVRFLGRSAGHTEYFIGPMAKQHRMATLTVACALCVPASFLSLQHDILYIALIVSRGRWRNHCDSSCNADCYASWKLSDRDFNQDRRRGSGAMAWLLARY